MVVVVVVVGVVVVGVGVEGVPAVVVVVTFVFSLTGTIKQKKLRSLTSEGDIGSTRRPDAVYQVSRSSVSWFRRRRFFLFFYHIWAWSCDLEHLNKFSFPTSHGGAI